VRDDSPRSGPFVLNIRLSGRLVPFSALLLLIALLPFLGGSAPQNPKASVVLAAGAPAEVNDAVAAVGQARNDLADSAIAGGAATAPTGSAFADALGGGLFMFPAIELTPLAAQAIAAPIVGGPTFIHPVPGGETSPFGPRVHPVLGRPMFHTGIDLAATCGTPIHAAASGTVIYARVSNSWGLRTIIEHTASLKTAYGHQSKFLVKEGDVVKQGQVIGLVGTTGWSTGCHLHFDVILNDRYVDPAPYLGFPPSDAKSVPYAVVPHLVFDQGGRIVHTVEDGDVPIPDATPAPSSSSGSGSSTTTRPPSSGPTSSTTPPPTTTKPPTSSPSKTTTPPPSTTSEPPTTTTNPPTTTSDPPSTTSDPPTTTSDPPQTTTSDPPATSDPPSTTSEAAPSPSTAEPSPTQTATETATAVLDAGTEAAATTAAADSTTSEPAPESTTAAEGGS
jgi:murein DD-endopeptidase MepM/ murein hydrolase activator NlpD